MPECDRSSPVVRSESLESPVHGPSLLRRTLAGGVLLALTALPALVATPAAAAPLAARGDALVDTPLVFAHRGASGYRREHTLAAYELAIRTGADVIEPDVVSTKDRVLVARHENEISGTTDVSERPSSPTAGRPRSSTAPRRPAGSPRTSPWAELRTLRAVERLPAVRQENTIYDGRYRVPTLQQVIDLAERASEQYGRTIGIAPETKHPTYFDSIGKSLEERLVRVLRRNDLDDAQHVYVQSFEEANLRELNGLIDLPLVQLTLSGPTARPYDHVASGDTQTCAAMTKPFGLREVATYADVLGPDKLQIFPRDAAGTTGTHTKLVEDAHDKGLLVVPFTVRAENQFLPAQHRSSSDPNAFGDVFAEIRDLLRVGVDGFFVDQPDIGVDARDDFLDR